MLERSPGYIAGLAIISVGFVLLVIGFATPYWISVSLGAGTSVYSGLWQDCESQNEGTKCQYLDVSAAEDKQVYAWFFATRGLESLAIIFYCAALMQVLVTNCSTFRNEQSKRVTSILSGISGAFGLVGTIVFGARADDFGAEKDLSWSFGVVIVGSCLAIIGSAVILFTANKSEIRIPVSQGVVIQSNVAVQGGFQYPVASGVSGKYAVNTGFNPVNKFHPQHLDSQYVVDVSDTAHLHASK